MGKYTAMQQRVEYPCETTLLREGKVAQNYYFIEKGCLGYGLTINGKDTTFQFFFENEGVSRWKVSKKISPALLR